MVSDVSSVATAEREPEEYYRRAILPVLCYFSGNVYSDRYRVLSVAGSGAGEARWVVPG